MSTYVVADIHGEYDFFMKMLQKLNLRDTDHLYILGDVLDRGPAPLKTLLKLMEMPNVTCMLGNHELMALKCLEFLSREITEESIGDLGLDFLEGFLVWAHYNGGQVTINEFIKLDRETREEIIAFLKELTVYQELTVGGKEYLLVHAGLGNFRPNKALDEYTLEELVWERPDYNRKYFRKKYVVTGHTPTQTIEDNPRPGYIFRKNNHIVIDCGCHWEDGRLGAICLDTGEEFYVERNEIDNKE